MNKLMKYSCFAIMALSALTFTACTEDYDYDPYTNVENSGFYFTEASDRALFYPEDTKSITVEVCRAESESKEAATVQLSASSNLVTLPSEVSFAAGESKKKITIPVANTPGIHDVDITIANEKDKFAYGPVTYSQRIIVCGEKLSGVFTSQQLKTTKNVVVYKLGNDGYDIKDCYEEGNDIVFSLDKESNIIVDEQLAWNHQKYGPVYVEDYESSLGVYPGSKDYKGYSGYDSESDTYYLTLKHYWAAGAFGNFSETLKIAR